MSPLPARSASSAPAVGVVVPSAGSGTRMGGEGPPKQFRALGGVPVLVHTLRALAACPLVAEIAVAASSPDETVALLNAHDVTLRGQPLVVVAGGATRGTSVRLAMEALTPAIDLVLAHDAVRPFVAVGLVVRVAQTVAAHGAAAAAVPVSDTLRRADLDGGFGATVERDGLWAMQTPQGARRDWLADAYARLGDDSDTDEAGLLVRAGYPVRIVEGDAGNFKLTRPSDWALAEAIQARG